MGKSRLIHLRCQYQPALHAGCMRAFDLAALPSYSLWESSYSLWESSAAYGGAVDLPVGRSSPGPGKRTRDTACGLAGRARSRPLAVAAHLIKFPRRFSVRRPCWCPGIRTGHGPVQGRLSPGGQGRGVGTVGRLVRRAAHPRIPYAARPAVGPATRRWSWWDR